MSIISLILIVAVVGFACWLLTTFVPMPPVFRSVIYGLACLILVLYVLQALGFVTGFSGLRLR